MRSNRLSNAPGLILELVILLSDIDLEKIQNLTSLKDVAFQKECYTQAIENDHTTHRERNLVIHVQ